MKSFVVTPLTIDLVPAGILMAYSVENGNRPSASNCNILVPFQTQRPRVSFGSSVAGTGTDANIRTNKWRAHGTYTHSNR